MSENYPSEKEIKRQREALRLKCRVCGVNPKRNGSRLCVECANKNPNDKIKDKRA